ncbi:MAG TPA: homoserine O-acetyltransferase [Bacteroidota bacterium]|nr:homoserine O-acetyltransferase [Bacteroidota bacterium]
MHRTEPRSAAGSTIAAGVTHGTLYTPPGPFALECGTSLPSLDIAYTIHGRLNGEGTNAVIACHALTGHAHAADAQLPSGETIAGWFNGIIGPSRGLDTGRFCVICSNILGSCYGTTGPASIHPVTGKAYGPEFPPVTVRDMVRAQKLLMDHIGVRRIAAVIGGSLGGMQALEWALLYPEMVERIIPIATSAAHSPWAVGISETQRLAIMSDPDWHGGHYTRQPERGLAIARSIAMLSYRSYGSFTSRFARRRVGPGDGHERVRLFNDAPPEFAVESYLRYQGQKLVDRFDANTYIALTRAMDAHDVGAGRGSAEDALGSIRARALVLGISSDILYPPAEQRAIAGAIPRARYAEINSPHGHDAFLIEFETMNRLLTEFIA